MSSPLQENADLNDDGHTPRRSSSRSIKRKKFDDELVESALKLPPENARRSHEFGSSDGKIRKSHHLPKISGKKRIREDQQPVPSDYGRWRPTDDLALISAVQQLNDLHAVHMVVKFSCRFTIKDVQERWHSLLYDPVVSRLAQEAMQILPAEIIADVESKAAWSKDEERILIDLPSMTTPAIQRLEELLKDNNTVFHKSRTPNTLLIHWHSLKHYELLSDQTVKLSGSHDAVRSMMAIQTRNKDEDLINNTEDSLSHEASLADRQVKKEIHILETEIPKWQTLVDRLTENNTKHLEFDKTTDALLRGKVVQYLVKSKEALIGRASQDGAVDIDLSLEGPASKISRKQGRIVKSDSNRFHLFCQGRHPFYVNGVPLVAGCNRELMHNSVIEVGNFHFLFLINPDLIVEYSNKSNVV